jgi:hypothetical protein
MLGIGKWSKDYPSMDWDSNTARWMLGLERKIERSDGRGKARNSTKQQVPLLVVGRNDIDIG